MNPEANNDGVTVEITNKMPDSARQYDESVKTAETRQINFFAGLVGEKLAKHVKKSAQKVDRAEIISTVANLTKAENGKYSGKIDFVVRVLQAGLTKDTPITIVCKDNEDDMPSVDALNAELDTVKSNEDKTAETIKASEEAENKIMAELSQQLEKEASAGPVAGGTLAPVIHVDKTWLPTSIKANDLVSIDGVRYVITGDDHNKLSAASDGAFWTLRIVDENHTPDTKHVKHMLI